MIMIQQIRHFSKLKQCFFVIPASDYFSEVPLIPSLFA